MRRPGFSLLEMIVVLALLGFLIVGLQQGLHFGMTMRDRATVARNSISGLDAADRAIRQLIERIEPQDEGTARSFAGISSALGCVTELPASAARDDRRIRARLMVDEQGLVLRWAALPHVSPLSQMPEQETLILPGVVSVTIAYAADPAGRRWLSAWQGSGIPPLIRVTLVFAPDDPRVWPDIIAAPLRKGGA